MVWMGTRSKNPVCSVCAVIGKYKGTEDTNEAFHSGNHERIRLSGIDCPEKGQAYDKRVKQAASDLAFRKEVTPQTHGLDKYGRTLADVLLPDGTNVNHTLVKVGWCWMVSEVRAGEY